MLATTLLVAPLRADAGAADCYPRCGAPEPMFQLAESYETYRAKREAAREQRRLLEAKARERRESERAADRKLRNLQRKLREGELERKRTKYGYGRYRPVDDGQAGAHCMYGKEGELIYAPEGASCDPVKGSPSPAPAAVDPALTQGCAAGDCKNGHGTYVWSDGSRYVGGFRDGLQHGQGSLAFRNGASYVGGWERGKRTGTGTAIFPDGRVKAGRWKDNRYLGVDESDGGLVAIEWPDLSRPAAPVGGGEHDYAVVVGIQDYAHVAKIPGAQRNAVDWYRYLVKTIGVPSDRVALLLDEDATREEIQLAVEDASRRIGRKGRLWFVFIGHGAPSTGGDDGLLVGFDAQQKARSLAARSLRRSDLIEALEESRADQIHVVLDACFSGRSGSGEQLVAGLQPLVVTSSAPTTDDRITLMTAAASDQYAGPLPGANRPAFSYLVLGGLRGWADGDGDGRVDAGELHDYAERTMRSTIRGRRQTPTFVGEEALRLGRSAREAGPDVAEIVVGAQTAGQGR